MPIEHQARGHRTGEEERLWLLRKINRQISPGRTFLKIALGFLLILVLVSFGALTLRTHLGLAAWFH